MHAAQSSHGAAQLNSESFNIEYVIKREWKIRCIDGLVQRSDVARGSCLQRSGQQDAHTEQ
jgi:hypothetical protein